MIIGLAEYSLECNILALIFVNRITGRNTMALTMRNWRGVWISSVILAQKVWDDQPIKTTSFAKILPNVSKEQLRECEVSNCYRLAGCLQAGNLNTADTVDR